MRCRLGPASALMLALAAPCLGHEVGERLPAHGALGVGLDGKPVTVGDLAGKPALLVFWASWCGDCARELPTAEALARRWGDRAVVIGISTDASGRELRRFLRKNRERLTFPISHDESKQVAREFDVREIPTNYLIDAEGVVRWRRVGFDDEWSKELAAVLREIGRPEPAASAGGS